MDLSVLIPLLNESESIIELNESIISSLKDKGLHFEIIYIDDGSTDNSWSIITNLSKLEFISGFRFQKNYGKSMALSAGFKKAKGKVVVTLDSDLQDDPNEIYPLYKMITDEKLDLISGWKKKEI